MELRPYDIELLRGEMSRYPLEETVVIKKELLDELLNKYEDHDDKDAEIASLKEEIENLESQMSA